MELWILGIVGWFACGLIATGITVAYFQEEFSLIAKETYYYSLGLGLFFLLGGPISVVMAFLLSERCKHGCYIAYRGVKVKDEPK